MQKLKNSELNRKTVEDFKQTPKIPLVLILDDVRSLNNIGSIFRTSDAFLVEKIYLCGITACPPRKDIHKTALGATDAVEWEYYHDAVQLVKALKAVQTLVYAIEQTKGALSLENFQIDSHQKYAFILGNEVKGVSQTVVDLCHGAIEIPQEGTKHSLNIAVAGGVVLWDFYQKFRRL
ncbi:MAG: TrmH family RNA methyltransferase [Flavobacteriia bacterium]|nr:TrmH family RNA methyltransferase [Flavobacteriia bacterium]